MTNGGAGSPAERLAIFFTWFDVFLVRMENLQSFTDQTFFKISETLVLAFVVKKHCQFFQKMIFFAPVFCKNVETELAAEP